MPRLTQKSCHFSTKDWMRWSFYHGRRRSQPGRTTGVPQTHTTCLQQRGLLRPKSGNASCSQRSRNRRILDRRDLIAARMRSLFFSGWTLSGNSKSPFYLSTLIPDILGDGNCVRSLHNTTQPTFQPAPSNYAQFFVVSSPSSANFRVSTNRTSASFPHPPMTTSLMFHCSFLLPSQMLPGPSVPQS